MNYYLIVKYTIVQVYIGMLLAGVLMRLIVIMVLHQPTVMHWAIAKQRIKHTIERNI